MVVLICWLLTTACIILLGNLLENQVILKIGAVMLLLMTAVAAASW